MSDQTTTPARMRGAIPTPRHVLAAARAFAPPVAAPMQFLTVPSRISMWGNDVHGDCVTAEEAFAKACHNPEIFITDTEVISWATGHDVLEGAYLPDVLTWMQHDGFRQGGQVYDDGTHATVDWTNPSALHAAIAQGPVKLGVAADQLDDAWLSTGGANGWFATGFHADPNEDHCVSLSGYGTIGWLAGQLHVSVPSGVNAGAPGYALFTWNSIGIIDQPSMVNITAEAWVRQPTTVIPSNLLPWPVLRKGANGHPVPTLQHLLNGRGASLTADGDFGPKTDAAVRKFQQSAGLTVDGIVGPATWSHVIRTVSQGSHGEAVKGVQVEINFRNLSGNPATYLAVDGQYGPKTKAAVRAFQQAVHLEVPSVVVDGVCGPVTWQALVSGMLSG
ncbi:MAG TPA: peptidoglycan-binding protein [Flexivirga sp.]|uniref:peptidoglycan-binding domain-containing protein n=1 Tax=Flexivirga sp. TaxID=1962927 RepID=UPI002D16B909|nr:peptidoglycan-binding protein [Flexivirga sp.]HWC22783.1 peptidoglycan-binding protein [Flexivirga sp.]